MIICTIVSILLFLIFYRYITIIYKINFINKIIKTKLNYIDIENETKKNKIISDKDLYLPNIIEFNILKGIKIKFNPQIIVAVLSSPHNIKKRFSFRQLSKNHCNRKTKCTFLFFTGYSFYQKKELLDLEEYIYNDIIQFSFQNSYTNLTILSIMAIKYCFRLFKNIDFYIKTDDDISINYKLLFYILKFVKRNNSNIYGHYSGKFKVNRSNKSGKYIPFFEYPYDICPEYVYGGLIIITYTSLSKIYTAVMQKQHYVWKEDVNLGIICKISNVTIKKFLFNIDIKLKSNDCKMKNNIIATEIYNKIDNFYCT